MKVEHRSALVFTKDVGGVTEVLVFRKSKALTRAEVREIAENTNGISYQAIEEAYIAAHGGEPPLMPM